MIVIWNGDTSYLASIHLSLYIGFYDYKSDHNIIFDTKYIFKSPHDKKTFLLRYDYLIMFTNSGCFIANMCTKSNPHPDMDAASING